MRISAHSPFLPIPFLLLFAFFALGILTAATSHLGHVLGSEGIAAIGVAFVIVFVLSNILAFIPTHIVLGADGVERKWLWFRRFIPFSAVREFRLPGWIPPRFILHSGEIVRLPYAVDNDLPGTRHARRALRSRTLLAISEAFERASKRAGGRTEGVAELLEPRHGESASKWRERLSAERFGYRDQAMRDVDLWTAVSDPLANARVRVGAALLLTKTVEAHERGRIAAIAATVASSNLRIALEQAADPSFDETQLDEVLERVKA